MVRSALRFGINFSWLISCTSHWLDVLDDKPFAFLKRHLAVMSQECTLDA